MLGAVPEDGSGAPSPNKSAFLKKAKSGSGDGLEGLEGGLKISKSGTVFTPTKHHCNESAVAARTWLFW